MISLQGKTLLSLTNSERLQKTLKQRMAHSSTGPVLLSGSLVTFLHTYHPALACMIPQPVRLMPVI
jgi:hypothetical protein